MLQMNMKVGPAEHVWRLTTSTGPQADPPSPGGGRLLAHLPRLRIPILPCPHRARQHVLPPSENLTSSQPRMIHRHPSECDWGTAPRVPVGVEGRPFPQISGVSQFGEHGRRVEQRRQERQCTGIECRRLRCGGEEQHAGARGGSTAWGLIAYCRAGVDLVLFSSQIDLILRLEYQLRVQLDKVEPFSTQPDSLLMWNRNACHDDSENGAMSCPLFAWLPEHRETSDLQRDTCQEM
ncbi:hypothetical protein B0H12DRAFT_1111520 [Mycena haematopus]|nr:hypothetical protein B0H12DRAFT_1111520 [Mycena haematopus]